MPALSPALADRAGHRLLAVAERLSARCRAPTLPRALAILSIAVGLAAAPPAFAKDDDDDDSIATDRPDFADSPDVVGSGRWQIEAGLTLDRDREHGVSSRVISTPVLLRRGIGKSFELRLETDGRTWQRVRFGGESDHASGWANLAPGFKWQVAAGDEESGLPKMAVIGQAELGTGSSDVADRHWRPTLLYVLQWQLPGDVELGVMPGVAREIDDLGRHYVSGILAVTAAMPIAGKFGGYLEVAASQLAADRHGGNNVFADGGFTWQTSDDTQWDIEIQRGITRDALDWSGGIGWSHRF